MSLQNLKGPIWISAGETSGDIHGAELLKHLNGLMPGRRFIGMGGPAMERAGLECLFRMESLSVMGVTEVISHLPRIFRLLNGIEISLKLHRPEAIVVIDAPDFHFKVIEAAARLNIPVYYYISPKIWAWRQRRAKFIKAHVRRMISILPFEEDFYKRFGMTVDYVGNPLVDMLDLPRMEKIAAVPGRVGLLPGSRVSEIKPLLPEFAAAAAIMHSKRPELEFYCMRAPGVDENLLRSLWNSPAPLNVLDPDDRYAFMKQCSVIIAASGTATLECALLGVPTIVAYKVSALSGLVGRTLIKVPYVSLPNLILEREVFPEFLQDDCRGDRLASCALSWLNPQSKALERVQEDLEKLRRKVGGPGAALRAAELIAGDLA